MLPSGKAPASGAGNIGGSIPLTPTTEDGPKLRVTIPKGNTPWRPLSVFVFCHGRAVGTDSGVTYLSKRAQSPHLLRARSLVANQAL